MLTGPSSPFRYRKLFPIAFNKESVIESSVQFIFGAVQAIPSPPFSIYVSHLAALNMRLSKPQAQTLFFLVFGEDRQFVLRGSSNSSLPELLASLLRHPCQRV